MGKLFLFLNGNRIIDDHDNHIYQNMTKPAINIVVALPSEARPINQHLGLVRDNRHDQYRIYRKDHISLVACGIGPDQAADVTDWLHLANDSRQNDIWINIGIAGHPSHKVGKIVQASAIEDAETGQVWHLEIKEDIPCSSERVVSVRQPDTSYTMNALVEMEAAGFYRSALKHTTPDRIYCIKVVSDNCDNPTHTLNGKIVSQLIKEHMDLLDNLITKINSDWE
ncbi:MAG: hypothetical protein P8Z39_01730 [Gammaproteobacteria bacterium]